MELLKTFLREERGWLPLPADPILATMEGTEVHPFDRLQPDSTHAIGEPLAGTQLEEVRSLTQIALFRSLNSSLTPVGLCREVTKMRRRLDIDGI